MKKFYLLRHEDLHKNSGLGVVAEGVIFDNNMGALTWLTDEPTMTAFVHGIQSVKKLHGHGGTTEIIIEGVKKDLKLFEQCQDTVRSLKAKRKHGKVKP